MFSVRPTVPQHFENPRLAPPRSLHVFRKRLHGFLYASKNNPSCFEMLKNRSFRIPTAPQSSTRAALYPAPQNADRYLHNSPTLRLHRDAVCHPPHLRRFLTAGNSFHANSFPSLKPFLTSGQRTIQHLETIFQWLF